MFRKWHEGRGWIDAVGIARANARTDLGMDRPSIQLRLQQAESLAQRLAENAAFQQQTIAKLELDDHDVRVAKTFLRPVTAAHARHVADRDRSFIEHVEPLVGLCLVSADHGRAMADLKLPRKLLAELRRMANATAAAQWVAFRRRPVELRLAARRPDEALMAGAGARADNLMVRALRCLTRLRILRRRDKSAMDDWSHLTQQESLPLLLHTRSGNSRPVVVGVSKTPPAITVILVISR